MAKKEKTRCVICNCIRPDGLMFRVYKKNTNIKSVCHFCFCGFHSLKDNSNRLHFNAIPIRDN